MKGIEKGRGFLYNLIQCSSSYPIALFLLLFANLVLIKLSQNFSRNRKGWSTDNEMVAVVFIFIR